MRSASSLRRMMTATAMHCMSSFHGQSLASALIVTAPTTRQSPSSPFGTSRHLQLLSRQQLRPHASTTICKGSSVDTVLTDNSSRADENSATGQKNEELLMQDMLYRIRECNKIPEDLRSRIVEFNLDGCVLGKVDTKVAEMLCSTKPSDGPCVFEMATDGGKTYLTLSEEAAGTTVESRTLAVGGVMEELKRTGIVTGWRDELYPISDSFYNPPLFLMERAATDLMGVLSYGVHINGIVWEEGTNQPRMWMARRSKTKSKFPGMLDHIVAGGQPAGLGLMENVIKECEEEAGIPPELFDRPDVDIRPVGVVSYEETVRCGMGGEIDEAAEEYGEDDDTKIFYKISRVVLFNYDLVLPQDFSPKPLDGEVDNFFLWDIDQIKESMARDFDDPIKPNCYLVIIDYLLRMGFVSPETKGYLDVLKELKSGDCQ
mmetsp:Transcript_16957/g.46548  ORF Transcript_16957/g.46548 Transcript_16957/m.46548 type:complete len:431 (+) Transcript_16957:311-1603(+)